MVNTKAKTKTSFVCNACGALHSQWSGQCSACKAWNTLDLERKIVAKPRSNQSRGYAAESNNTIQALADVAITETPRIPTSLTEFDRVLGGGLVSGSVVLLGGDPGVGKSTILLQTLAELSQIHKVLYITGEESLQQVAMRAKRLNLNADAIQVLSETNVTAILAHMQQEKPTAVVIDSIQTMFSDDLPSAPGSVSQVREAAAQFVQFAKQTNTAIFLVGHVTKEGALAGPRVLEHMVDTVLYFEGTLGSRFRLVRAIKNRFGAVNELGVFAMTEQGLREVNNPSKIFLSRYEQDVAGSVVFVTWEGTRPLLVEVQALVDETHSPQPRRVTVGLEHNRIAMLLAVLNRHGGIVTFDQDVFVNVVGGVRITETAVDLPLLAAVVSSLRNRSLPRDLILFGEVGLAGEIRPVQSGQERLKEAAKHGFKRAIVPQANAPKAGIDGLQVTAVANLQQMLQYLQDL